MKRIPSIDGFRAISIALVIVNHILNSQRRSSIWYLVGNGSLGVFIFFVISGFLITTLLLRECDSTGHISLARFYFRRAFRILPPLYFYSLFVVVTACLLDYRVPHQQVLMAITLTQNLFFGTKQWQFEHFWSLCIEEQFYLVWPLALSYVLFRSGKVAAARLAVALIALAPLLRIVVYIFIHNQETRHYFLGLLPAKMDGLMYGSWAALTVGTPQFERIYSKASSVIWLLALWVGIISNYLTIRYMNFYSLPLGQTIDGLFIAILLVWAARNPGSKVGRFLNWRPIVHLGLISYSVYIWQTWFLHEANHTLFGRLPWSLLCIWIMAEISYYAVERLSRKARDLCEPRFFRHAKYLKSLALPER
jgi:peptidoglycan/LPS O-acetylase OafA/YrhL